MQKVTGVGRLRALAFVAELLSVATASGGGVAAGMRLYETPTGRPPNSRPARRFEISGSGGKCQSKFFRNARKGCGPSFSRRSQNGARPRADLRAAAKR